MNPEDLFEDELIFIPKRSTRKIGYEATLVNFQNTAKPKIADSKIKTGDKIKLLPHPLWREVFARIEQAHVYDSLVGTVDIVAQMLLAVEASNPEDAAILKMQKLNKVLLKNGNRYWLLEACEKIE